LAREVAGYWKDATVIDVDGGNPMHAVSPEATARAITRFAEERLYLA
jgi:hypothetical protein